MKLALVFIAGFTIGVLLMARNVYETSRTDYVRVTLEGIDIGYRCQAKGFTQDFCRADYRKFMGAVSEAASR